MTSDDSPDDFREAALMRRRARIVLGMTILIVSVALFLWGFLPARRETRTQPISPTDLQLPTPASLDTQPNSFVYKLPHKHSRTVIARRAFIPTIAKHPVRKQSLLSFSWENSYEIASLRSQ
jgi:hypothetical protein